MHGFANVEYFVKKLQLEFAVVLGFFLASENFKLFVFNPHYLYMLDKAPRGEVEREAALSKFSSSEDEQAKRDSPPPVNTAKLSRPASNFVKRSPIPPPPTARETNKNAADGRSRTGIRKEASEILKLEELKLVELKELAREKGVKGYSRLKKGELIELLKVLVPSS